MGRKSEDGPDRGWSWIIAFACFLISLILVGLYRTSGVLLVAFMKEYGISREDSSWPLFLCFSLVDIAGLITGPLGQQFGVRAITLIGSLVSAVGVSLCYFANSFTFITVSFGIIFGVGFGLTYNLMPIIINQYFLKHRATANGIANSGACFGSVIFPPIYEYLLFTYGLNGCLLLIGGIILQLAISGSLMKPPSWLKSITLTDVTSLPRKGFKDIKYSSLKTDAILSLSTTMIFDDAVGIKEKNILLHLTNSESENAFEQRLAQENLRDKMTSYANSTNSIDICNKENGRNISQFVTPSEHEQDDCEVINTFEVFTTIENKQEIINSCIYLREIVDVEPGMDEKKILISTPNDLQVVVKNEKHASKISLEQQSEELDTNCYNVKDDMINRCSVETHDVMSRKQASHIQKTKHNWSILMSFKHVLTCPMFYVIAISNVLFFSKEEMFFVINVDFYMDKGIAEHDTKYIIFVFSVADLFGRLCLGWVTDRKYLRRSHFMMICMTAVAVVFFCFPFADGYISLLVLNSIYGVLLGCTTIIFFVIPVDYLDMETHAVAFGCMAFINGLLTLTFSFLIGHFRDYLGSYSSIFYIMGAVSLVAAGLWLTENCFTNPMNESENVEEA